MPLAIAFWRWAVLAGLPLNLLALLVSLVLLTQRETAWALVVGHGATLPFNLLVAVGVWRAAARYQGPRIWAEAAKTATVAGMVVLTIL